MNDPHVESLFYKAESPEDITYVNPPPLRGNEKEFSFVLEDGKLTISMIDHFAIEKEARVLTDPFVRAWEMKQALENNSRSIWFSFEEARIIDRNPTPGQHIVVGTARFNIEMGVVRGQITRNKYPEPPKRFAVTPDVETLWNRYRMYKEGRETLLAMAYACLTLIEGSTHQKPGREAASKLYAIAFPILKQIGDWTSTKGDAKEARKLGASATFTPLTPSEREWLDAAIRILIRRKAELDADPTAPLAMLQMIDVK